MQKIVLLVLLVFLATASAWHYVPTRCREDSDLFQRKQANQLGGLTTDPQNIVWVQNATYMANFVPGVTTYVDVVNFIFYQRQWYDQDNCRWLFEELYNRGPGVWVYSKIESRIRSEQIGIPLLVDLEARYDIEFVEMLYDQQAATSLDVVSRAGSRNQLYNAFIEPNSGNAFFDQIITNLVDHEKKYYSLDFYDPFNPAALPIWGYHKTDAVAISSLPADVQGAFNAIDNDELVTINDPLADLDGETFPVLAYVHQQRDVDTYQVPSVSKCHSMFGFATKSLKRAGKLSPVA